MQFYLPALSFQPLGKNCGTVLQIVSAALVVSTVRCAVLSNKTTYGFKRLNYRLKIKLLKKEIHTYLPVTQFSIPLFPFPGKEHDLVSYLMGHC